MSELEKEFDAVSWVRAHRDENQQKYANLTTKDFARKFEERAAASSLWKQLIKRPDQSRKAAS